MKPEVRYRRSLAQHKVNLTWYESSYAMHEGPNYGSAVPIPSMSWEVRPAFRDRRSLSQCEADSTGSSIFHAWRTKLWQRCAYFSLCHERWNRYSKTIWHSIGRLNVIRVLILLCMKDQAVAVPCLFLPDHGDETSIQRKAEFESVWGRFNRVSYTPCMKDQADNAVPAPSIWWYGIAVAAALYGAARIRVLGKYQESSSSSVGYLMVKC